MSPSEISGKRVRAEYRIGRRTHNVGIGTLRVGPSGVEAVFSVQSQAGVGSYVFQLSERQLKHLVPSHHGACDFQFSGVLDFEEGVSEDNGVWTRPPKIITVDDVTPNS